MKLRTFIICDDIRNEIGNKFSLIGVYGDKINFNVTPDKKDSWPRSMRIGIFAEFDIESDNPHSFQFKMKYNENTEILGKGVRDKPKTHEEHKLTITIVLGNFLFDKPGYIKFTFDFFDADKKLIASLSPEFDVKINELVATSN